MLNSSHDITTAVYIFEWIIRLGALIVVPRRRAPAPTSAWLLLIFFFPIPGLIVYLAIGRPRFPAWRSERFKNLLPFFETVANQLKISSLPGDGPNDIADLVHKLGYFPAVGGCSIALIAEYDEVIDRLVADIDRARRHVRILVYIFAADATGRKVIAALQRAVARGVPCQVIVDAVGSQHFMSETRRQLSQAGVDMVEGLPFHLIRGRTRRDMRNHRKLFVIDGEIAFAGSQNIVAKDFRPGVVNRELVARVTGPVVAAMEAVILGDWYLETEKMPTEYPRIPPATGTACAQLLPSGANYPLEGFETLLVWQIHQARRRVIMVTPYFIPDEGLGNALRTAAARGVQVDLIVSAVVDQRLVNLAQRSYYEELLAAGIRVHLFRTYLLHAKAVSIDDRLAVVGSSNVDLRSFQLNDETSLLLLDPDSAKSVADTLDGYLKASDPLRLDQWRERPIMQKMGENLARLISPLL